MTDHASRLWLKDIFNLLPDAKEEFIKTTGINPDVAPLYVLTGGIEAIVEGERLRHREEREDAARHEAYEFIEKIEQGKQAAIKSALQEAARIIQEGNEHNIDRLAQILDKVQLAYATQSSTALKAVEKDKPSYSVPPAITYMNCWRRHKPDKDYPLGRPGPEGAIHTTPSKEGTRLRCNIAFSSHNVFSKTKYQMFHEKSLVQGDCPRPKSRNLGNRIPLISFLHRPDICPLADGKEYILREGVLYRVSD